MTQVSLVGDDKLFDAHRTQHNVPIHTRPSRTGPPLAELFDITQTELPSTSTELPKNAIALLFALKLHDANIHWLESEMIAEEEEVM